MPVLFGLELSTALIVLIVTLCAIILLMARRDVPKNIPPFPARPFPILGHIPYLGEPRKKLLEWQKTTGALFSLYFGPTLVVVVSSYDLLREALVKKAEYFSHRDHRGILPPLNVTDGIVGSSGELWKENRTLTLNLLRSFGMGKNEMAESIVDEVSIYLSEISKFSGKPMNPKDLTSRSVSNIVCRFLIGKRFEYDDSFYASLLEVYDDSVNIGNSSGLLHWFDFLKYVPGDFFNYKRLVNNDKMFRSYVQKLVQGVVNDENHECNEDNFIASYVEEMRKREAAGKSTNLSMSGLETCIMDLLTAGTETTTTTLLWFFIYMVHNPKLQEKIYDEIERETGGSRLPAIADRAKMTLLHATMLEVQRISSIVPLSLLHRVNEECTLGGYTIPKDALMIPHLDAAHFDEKIWENPRSFKPERFLSANGRVTEPEQFVPFSLGRRLCLGEALARMELFLFAALAVQRFKILPVDPKQLPPLTDSMGLTYPPTSFEVKFEERS